MPSNASDIYCTLHRDGTGTFLARLVGNDGLPLTRSDLASAAYSVFLLDDQDPDLRTPVVGHENEGLAVAEVLSDSLTCDALWTVDATGYNFRHTVDVQAQAAFAVAGRRYLVEYRFLPVDGQVILLRYRVNVI